MQLISHSLLTLFFWYFIIQVCSIEDQQVLEKKNHFEAQQLDHSESYSMLPTVIMSIGLTVEHLCFWDASFNWKDN